MVNPGTPAVRVVCGNCGEWYDEAPQACTSCGSDNLHLPSMARARVRRGGAQLLSEVSSAADSPRIKTRLRGLNRVLGGGFTDDMVVLVTGRPGAGKSTLVLQVVNDLATQGHRVLYAGNEENSQAIKERAMRLELHISGKPIYSLRTEFLDEALAEAMRLDVDVVVVDSGNVTRSSKRSPANSSQEIVSVTNHLRDFAKARCVTAIVVGQLNAEGETAGPLATVHAVDTHLHFDTLGGGRRFVEARKNRHGPEGEVAFYEMTGQGLLEAPDPADALLAQTEREPGIVFFVDAKRARPQLVRVEALVTPSDAPELRVRGVDRARVTESLYLLRQRADIDMAKCDVAVEVGTVLGDPCRDEALDLAIALALVSAQSGTVTPWPCAAFGRVSVRGRIEAVDRDFPRIVAAQGWGIEQLLVPEHTLLPTGLRTPPRRLRSLSELPGWLAASARRAETR